MINSSFSEGRAPQLATSSESDPQHVSVRREHQLSSKSQSREFQPWTELASVLLRSFFFHGAYPSCFIYVHLCNTFSYKPVKEWVELNYLIGNRLSCHWISNSLLHFTSGFTISPSNFTKRHVILIRRRVNAWPSPGPTVTRSVTRQRLTRPNTTILSSEPSLPNQLRQHPHRWPWTVLAVPNLHGPEQRWHDDNRRHNSWLNEQYYQSERDATYQPEQFYRSELETTH